MPGEATGAEPVPQQEGDSAPQQKAEEEEDGGEEYKELANKYKVRVHTPLLPEAWRLMTCLCMSAG